jgi:hypothetical protein
VAAYFVEVGILLAVAPWTPLWDRNYFAAAWPQVRLWMSLDLIRAAVSAAGLLTMLAGVSDVYLLFTSRHSRPRERGSIV